MLPSEYCTDGTRTELFIAGSEPRKFCTFHEFKAERNAELIKRLQDNYFSSYTDIDQLEQGILNLHNMETLRSMQLLQESAGEMDYNRHEQEIIDKDLLD